MLNLLTHAFIGVYFPGIIISRLKLHVEHRLLFKVRRQHIWPARAGLSSSTRNRTHSRGSTRSPDLQQIAEKDIHFERCQRATDRQGSALSEHTAAWFAPMWQNNQNWRVSYCFLALLWLFGKGLLDWKLTYTYLTNRRRARYVFVCSALKRNEIIIWIPRYHTTLVPIDLSAHDNFDSPLFISFSCNPK